MPEVHRVVQPVQAIYAHESSVYALIHDSTRGLLFSGGVDRRITRYDIKARRVLGTTRAHRHAVMALALSPDHTLLASGSYDHSIKIWDIESGSLHRRFDVHSIVQDVQFSPDGRRIAAASGDYVRIWSVGPAHLETTIEGHDGWVTGTFFLPGGDRIITSSTDGRVRVFNVPANQEVASSEDLESEITGIDISLAGNLLVAGCSDGRIHAFSLDTLRKTKEYHGHEKPVSGIRLVRDHRVMVSGDVNGTTCAWDVRGGQQLELTRAPGIVHSFEPIDSTTIACASSDNNVYAWQPVLASSTSSRCARTRT